MLTHVVIEHTQTDRERATATSEQRAKLLNTSSLWGFEKKKRAQKKKSPAEHNRNSRQAFFRGHKSGRERKEYINNEYILLGIQV